MPDPATTVTDSRYRPVAEHARRYAATGGAEGHLWNGVPTLLLTTTGRVTGALRRTALIYSRLDTSYIVVASNLGADRHPDWYRNLAHTPVASIQVGSEHLPVHARTATDDERAELWQTMTRLWPDYVVYQRKTTRTIPVVVLTPTPATVTTPAYPGDSMQETPHACP